VTTAEGTCPLTLDDLAAEGITTSVERAAQYLGISRAYGYQMAREGVLPTIKLGPRRLRVPTAGLRKMLAAD
jgi:excisionase family DNA binding protein